MKTHLHFFRGNGFLLAMRWLLGYMAIALTACSIQLAPRSDQALLDGIQQVNKQIMEVYASASMGASRDTFPMRVEQYNRIIGTLDALALQAKSRPMPDAKTQGRIAQALRDLGKTDGLMGTDLSGPMARMAADCAAIRKVNAPAVNVPDPTPSTAYVPASATALMQASRGITFLRDSDCVNGLDAGRVAVNRGFVTHFMAQAITYETYLKE
ncbi:hypothetical protein [Achromobacter insolitus]|uniref:hypothetical protein n=1 Tax=Achromobacter insolitus TaxID=217204 RepID=UPI0020A6187E|nr:hypothetical protein [Achromobacter insolitus]MCP1399868.1 hypothetical protein [Achromobacter insolitus]